MSIVLKGFKIRAYPNATQRALATRTLGTKRWLWNTALELRSAAYKELGLRLTSTDISRMLTQWKKTPKHEWLAAIPATALTQTLRDLDRAFSNFFAHRAHYSRIKKRRHGGCGFKMSVRRNGAKASWHCRSSAGSDWPRRFLTVPNPKQSL